MLGNTPSQLPTCSRSDAIQSSAMSEALRNKGTRHPSLECWRLRQLWMTYAREHALPAAPTSSRSGAIQSSAMSEALQKNSRSATSSLGCRRLRPPNTHAREHVPNANPSRRTPPTPRRRSTEVWDPAESQTMGLCSLVPRHPRDQHSHTARVCYACEDQTGTNKR